MNGETYKIILFYKFADVKNPKELCDGQKRLCHSLNLKGRMLIAEEGINATFEGTIDDVDTYKCELAKNPMWSDIVFKESAGTGNSFSKLKIKVRDEVVTLGAGRFDVKNETAKEISVEELNELYKKDEDFVVLDLRNDYEIEAGYFDKTIHPDLHNFRELPEKLEKVKHLKNQKVITVCTGGIRCEKATCLLKREGFDNLYQLKDGIHTYMAKYPGTHFKGSLFVFDNRMITDVVPTDEREVVGVCKYCNVQCENFYNDDTTRPSRKVICCDTCAPGKNLRACIMEPAQN